MILSQTSNPILDSWRRTLAAKGSSLAILGNDGRAARTFQEIEDESLALEKALSLHHLPVGGVVGVQIGNSLSWAAVLLALFRRRLLPMPLGEMDEAETLAALGRFGAAALIRRDADCALGISILQLSGAAPPFAIPGVDFLKLTSGTTGAPRAVLFTADQLHADCINISSSMGIGPSDLNYGAIPMSHSYGFSNLLTPLICCGVPLALSEDRLPRALLDGLHRSGATVFPGMPIFYDKLAALAGSRFPEGLRLCISAGSPLTPKTARDFHQVSGKKVHTFYGSSECGGIAYDASDEVVEEEGFVGTPMDGVAIHPLEDLEAGGRIQIQSRAVGLSYFPEPDPDVLSNGRFTPGDLVRWSGTRMYMTGRVSEVINVAGRKLHPAEIETKVAEFPGIRRVVAFGVPSPLRGEVPVLCVEGDESSRNAVIRFCAERLSSWQVPRDIWFVGEIPTNERGKVSRRTLCEAYMSRVGT